MELVALDKPGLLAQVSRFSLGSNLNLLNAKITTVGKNRGFFYFDEQLGAVDSVCSRLFSL